jgi:hypothetical protein
MKSAKEYANEHIESIDKMLDKDNLRLKNGHGEFKGHFDAIKRLVKANPDPNSLTIQGLVSDLEKLKEKLSSEGKPQKQFLGILRGSRQVASEPPSRRHPQVWLIPRPLHRRLRRTEPWPVDWSACEARRQPRREAAPIQAALEPLAVCIDAASRRGRPPSAANRPASPLRDLRVLRG